jgi:hypothetical protein
MSKKWSTYDGKKRKGDKKQEGIQNREESDIWLMEKKSFVRSFTYVKIVGM